MAETYDLCFAWSWPYDNDFANLLQVACESQLVSIFFVTPSILEAVLQALSTGQLEFHAFFDRASDVDEKYQPLVEWAYRQDLHYINRFWLARRTWDKATMHHLLTRSGLDAPYTVILPSYLDSPELPVLDLSPLGEYYALKPAHGGGGKGVIVGALTWEQILQTRQQAPDDQYLLQAQVFPIPLNQRPAWFRVIYCLGKIFPCWWDPNTHCYLQITEIEIAEYDLSSLFDITQRIAQLSRLELFSTEIAMIEARRFLVVDYVNDPIDLRLQSRYLEGVPDEIIKEIVQELATSVAAQKGKGLLDV